jgi:hypothetical protein
MESPYEKTTLDVYLYVCIIIVCILLKLTLFYLRLVHHHITRRSSGFTDGNSTVSTDISLGVVRDMNSSFTE